MGSHGRGCIVSSPVNRMVISTEVTIFSDGAVPAVSALASIGYTSRGRILQAHEDVNFYLAHA